MEQRQSNQHAFSLNQQTPLHLAARKGHMDTVQLLVGKQANTNTQDIHGISIKCMIDIHFQALRQNTVNQFLCSYKFKVMPYK